MRLLADLHSQGRTIVMVTHSDEIARYAQRVVRFRDGQIESDHANGEIFSHAAYKEAVYAG
jgi:putative ABC transport system ATP-binding protein